MEFEGVEAILEKHLPAEELARVNGVLYGKPCEVLPLSDEAKNLSEEKDFEIKAFKVNAAKEHFRAPRLVRVGLIQNAIVKPTTAPLNEQYEAIRDRVTTMIEAAAHMGVNVICLQEAWTMPFAFCTRESQPWCEFAEDPYTGRTTEHLSKLAKKYNMVILSPILERDSKFGDIMWNCVVVIGNRGNVIGIHRKNHIPRVGDFNEANYYIEGNCGHPVFETDFGRIAINICFGRHHPLNWAMFGWNGAEMVFNPSATVGALSEPMWRIEARNAAIANSYFSFAINRVGTEVFPNEFTSGNGQPAHKDFGHFYGSSYSACPDASRTPSLSRTRDGLHVTEIDLNLIRQVKDSWNLQMTSRLPLYAESFRRVCQHDFEPQIIKDTGRNSRNPPPPVNEDRDLTFKQARTQHSY
eukprot:GCRY01000368.1.p1 GENE.GCRY01000368.1~~GCRY01000368.1.p1  ORF type:complete len:442 (-),score=82.47 GCRY01000368.1:30-1262(-)